MLAYARLLVREAQRHGGRGWLDYDRIFHQQAALDPHSSGTPSTWASRQRQWWVARQALAHSTRCVGARTISRATVLWPITLFTLAILNRLEIACCY